MKQPKSLTGVIHLPDVRFNFHVSFGDHKNPIELKGEAKSIGHILNQAARLSPDLQELMITFADYLQTAAERAQKGNGQGDDGQDSEK